MPIAHVAAGDDILASYMNSVVDKLQDTTAGHAHNGSDSAPIAVGAIGADQLGYRAASGNIKITGLLGATLTWSFGNGVSHLMEQDGFIGGYAAMTPATGNVRFTIKDGTSVLQQAFLWSGGPSMNVPICIFAQKGKTITIDWTAGVATYIFYVLLGA